jgi:hypothetical protein
MSDSDVPRLRAQLEALERPSVSKVRLSLRESFKRRSQSEFCAAFAACGLGVRELARHLGIAPSYVHDMLHGRRYIPDWVFRAMPREGRLVVARGYLDDVDREPPSSASGWR